MPGHIRTTALILFACECQSAPSEAAEQYGPELIMDVTPSCSPQIFCICLGDLISLLKAEGSLWKGISLPICTETALPEHQKWKESCTFFF